jgi:hypothetical protein
MDKSHNSTGTVKSILFLFSNVNQILSTKDTAII